MHPLVTTLLGLGLALLVDKLRGQAVYKSLIFMPMAVSFVGASFIWRFVYETRDPAQAQVGLLSQVAMWLGFDHPPNWILQQPLNTFLLVVAMIWVQTGFARGGALGRAQGGARGRHRAAARMDGAHGPRLLFFVDHPDDPQHDHRGSDHCHDHYAEGVRHRPHDDRRQLRHPGAGQRDVLRSRSCSATSVAAAYWRRFSSCAVLPLVIYQIRQLRREA